MTVHRPHPISGPWPYGTAMRAEPGPVDLIDRIPVEGSVIYDDPEDALLFDACDRCAEHASHPLASVDTERLGRLWTEMVRVERDRSYRDYYRTRAEAQACRELYRIACMVERTHPLIEPWTWPWHVRAGRTTFALGGEVDLEVSEITFGSRP